MVEKLVFWIQKLSRLTWYQFRYRIYPWKKVAGLKFPVVLSMDYAVLRFIDNGEYEAPLLDIVRHTLDKNDIALELGAGMGFISSFCAQRVGSDKVFTFEANRKMEPLIRKMYTANQVQPQLRFGLLGQGNKQVHFYTHKESFLASSVHEGDNMDRVLIDQFDLNETIAAIKPTYLVLDIEGAEYDILQQIDFQTIRKIQLETHPRIVPDHKMQEVYERLEANGFVRDPSFSYPENFFFYKP